MPWTLYKNWNGGVTGSRIRVPSGTVGASAFGPSANALHLAPGALGTIVNILPEGAALPAYVRFQTKLNTAFAAEVRFLRAENTEAMWRDFRNMWMPGNEAIVLITRPVLDTLEIEYTLDHPA